MKTIPKKWKWKLVLMVVVSLFLSCEIFDSDDDDYGPLEEPIENGIPGLAYLGAGYNIFGEYAKARSVKARLIDFYDVNEVEYLGNFYYLPRQVQFINLSESTFTSRYGKSIKEYQEDFRQSVKIHRGNVFWINRKAD